jgi:hypothetical protein
MTNEERIALILEMKGQEGVKALTADLEAQKNELKQIKAAFDSGDISMGEFLQEQHRLQEGIAGTAGVMQQLTGSGGRGAGGRGILGASYAFQDFTSQIQNGFLPALSSIQNNIPQILMGMGMGSGMVGIVSAAAVGFGLLAVAAKSAFGGETKEAIEEAKEKLKEFEAQVKSVHEAFLKMTQKATTPEEEAAANLKAILEDRPNAERIAAAIAQKIGEKRVLESLSPEEMTQLGGINQRILSDEQIKASAQFGDPATIEAQQKQARQASEKAEQERHELLLKARRRIGEQTVVDAAKAGPEGAAALRRLKEYAPADITSEIEANSADAIKKTDEENEAFNEGNERAHEQRLKRQERAKAEAKQKAAAAKAARERIAARDKIRRESMQDQDEADRRFNDEARGDEQGDKKAEADARRERQRAGQEAVMRSQDLERAVRRSGEDREYWTKVNSGMISAAEQLGRQSQIMRRNTEDMQRRLQHSMMQGNDG